MTFSTATLTGNQTRRAAPVLQRQVVRQGSPWGWAHVLALLAFGLVLTTNVAAIASGPSALAVTLVCRTPNVHAAGGAGGGLRFWHPDGVAAVRDQVPPLAWVLLLGNLFWVIAYDTGYAMVDR
jgi:4-hydroxybenzoate polyprenyltransferase